MKFRRLLKYLAVAAFSFLAASCNKGEEGYGFLKLDVVRDSSEIIVGVKAQEEIFRVEVYDARSQLVASYPDHHDLAAHPLQLKAGSYRAVAVTGNESAAPAFESPVYKGEKEFTVLPGRTNAVEVVCTLAQVKVSVSCGSDVAAQFPTIALTVTDGADFSDKAANIVFSSADGTLAKAGYLSRPGTLRYSLYLISADGIISDGVIAGEIAKTAAREHYRFTLKVKGEENTIPGMKEDPETGNRYFDVSLNLNKKDQPAVTGEGFDLSGKLEIVKGAQDPVKLNVTSAAGIHELFLSHAGTEAFVQAGIPQTVDLASLPDAARNALNQAGITWTEPMNDARTAVVDFTALLAGLPAGDYGFTLSVTDKQAQTVEVPFRFTVLEKAVAIETETIGADPWGRHAFLSGKYLTAQQPAGMGFEYRKEADADWIRVDDASLITVDGVNYSAKVTGLEPRTAYVFRSCSRNGAGAELAFTTLGADQLPNMGFDQWYKEGKHQYPNADANHFWWDSGNVGANTLKEINPTKPEASFLAVPGAGKQAARLGSTTAARQFAAGSLFLGKFISATLSPLGAKLDFGRPYTCKPLALKGYYSYAPGDITHSKVSQAPVGSKDIGKIYVILTDWDGPFHVNTGNNAFIDVEGDPQIIAYGELEDNVGTGGQYKEFEIKLNYRNNRIPKQCVIVCTSSKYGDYFTGSTSSVMYVDEFEFIF